MRYISEERLLEINPDDYNTPEGLFSDLVRECTELNPWQLIDENTPKDRELHLYQFGIGQWIDYLKEGHLKPTHYQELPEDPT